MTADHKPCRVFRFERADGNYCELASNEIGPNQIPVPSGYKFVCSTTMIPEAVRDEVIARVRSKRGLAAATARCDEQDEAYGHGYVQALDEVLALLAPPAEEPIRAFDPTPWLR